QLVAVVEPVRVGLPARPTWRIDVDHLSPVIGKHYSCQRAGDVLAKVHDANAVEYAHPGRLSYMIAGLKGGAMVAGFNSQGLNLSDLEHTSQDEIDAHLTTRWKGRGPLYDMYASSLMLDYNPKFAKLHWWGAEVFRSLPSEPEGYDPMYATPNSIQQLHSYMMLGWETGIRNQFRVLRRL